MAETSSALFMCFLSSLLTVAAVRGAAGPAPVRARLRRTGTSGAAPSGADPRGPPRRADPDPGTVPCNARDPGHSGGVIASPAGPRRSLPSQRGGGVAVRRLAWGHAAAPRDRPDRQRPLPRRQRLRLDGGRADVLRRPRPLRSTPSTPARRPFVDTAEMYGAGRSEQILGGWMADRGLRDRVVVATKASPMDKEHPLSAAGDPGRGRALADAGCRPTGSTCTTPTTTTRRRRSRRPCRRSTSSCRRGKVRYVAASNYSAARLRRGAARPPTRLGVRGYVALQPHYNLMERAVYEDGLRDARPRRSGLGRAALLRAGPRASSPASTGRGSGSTHRARRRRGGVRGGAGRPGAGGAGRRRRGARACRVAAVALRWLADQPTVVGADRAAPASVEQLADLLPMRDLRAHRRAAHARWTDASAG